MHILLRNGPIIMYTIFKIYSYERHSNMETSGSPQSRRANSSGYKRLRLLMGETQSNPTRNFSNAHDTSAIKIEFEIE